uniref:Uncharacterized protein n=1 Tax=Caenorhabditis japonica TaxID=281687 RepID=A0A8R1EHP9_CAEJA
MKVLQLSRKRSTMNTRISRISQDFGLDALAVDSVDSVRKFLSRLMKDGKPDEYAADEASNFQFPDSP